MKYQNILNKFKNKKADIFKMGFYPVRKECLLFVDQVEKHDGNQQKTIQNGSAVQNGVDINIHLASSANFIANNNESIPQRRLSVNSLTASPADLTAPKPGETKTMPNQTAERLVSNSESTESRGLVNNLFIKNNLSKEKSFVKQER